MRSACAKSPFLVSPDQGLLVLLVSAYQLPESLTSGQRMVQPQSSRLLRRRAEGALRERDLVVERTNFELLLLASIEYQGIRRPSRVGRVLVRSWRADGR